MASFSLLETMRLERGRIVRLDRHLARIAASARYFGYAWDDGAIRQALAACTRAHPGECWRVRLLVSAEGVPTIECGAFTPDEKRIWRVAFAEAPVDPDDPFLFNKTTRRTVYEEARRARVDVDEVLLWNTRGEVTEATIANVIAEIEGVRYTPPVSCGLLGGIFRAELIESSAVRERVLTKMDVTNATRVWLVNSLREWMDATVVD